ncbi:PD40 domain-containing protein [Nostoc sp. FACHB-133]|uniref:PD40 domain-containing protein n=1 Tax=Nostoc sp. FACHB-133 TaxID=2692835 RepID=UPI001681E729|nr:PD40 domain-containing protein [Nostoc sp. FACHB-133]MBD2527145.1 PD40 domain-containing protein [Nostoc sp. FACHB-133]
MMRLIKFLALILLGLLSATIFNFSNAVIAAPKVSQDNRLTFVATKQGPKYESNIYTIQTNGSARRQLTKNLNVYPTIVWLNNGKRLAFFNDAYDVYTMNADGSKLTKIFSGAGCKADSIEIQWLLNGQKLAIKESCDGSTLEAPGGVSLYLSDTIGTQGTKLIQRWEVGGIPPKAEISSSLYLSPNGQQVVFFKDKSIWQMNTDGSNLTELTNAPGDDYPSQVIWSPDGTQIAISWGKDNNQPIYLLNVKNKTLTNLSDEPQKTAYSGIISWSLDGTKLAYYHNQGTDYSGKELDIFVLDVNQKAVKKLTSKPGEYSGLQWSPDSKLIAFTSGDYSQKKLYTISIDRLKLTQLSSQLPPSEINSFNWSLDGKKISFIKTEKTKKKPDGQSVLYVSNRDGSKLTKLSKSDDSYISAQTWQP